MLSFQTCDLDAKIYITFFLQFDFDVFALTHIYAKVNEKLVEEWNEVLCSSFCSTTSYSSFSIDINAETDPPLV